MTWIKHYRMNRAELVKYFGTALVVQDTNSAKTVWKLYR